MRILLFTVLLLLVACARNSAIVDGRLAEAAPVVVRLLPIEPGYGSVEYVYECRVLRIMKNASGERIPSAIKLVYRHAWFTNGQVQFRELPRTEYTAYLSARPDSTGCWHLFTDNIESSISHVK
jgi:hypothetical protein